MAVFSYHLSRSTLPRTVAALVRPPVPERVPGLRHAQVLTPVALGAPLASPARVHPGRLSLLARWDDEGALDDWLGAPGPGPAWADGWHVRLAYLRRWGAVTGLDDLPAVADEVPRSAPVAAVTLARLRLTQAPRFARWGRPAEQQVAADPAMAFGLAVARPLRTIATFTAWRSRGAMEAMVAGHADPRHADAMAARVSRDFHHEFTTLRFRPLSEHGAWEGRTGLVPR